MTLIIKKLKLSIFILTIFLTSCADNTMKIKSSETNNKAEWELAFKISNLPQPESVAYDKSRNVLFVSNQNHEKEGFISLLNINGTIIKKKWLEGLVNPKGIKVVGDKLYVSDETVLIEIEIDINKAKIIKQYKGKESKLLNDVEVDIHGNVYVSDMLTSSIYKLDTNGNFTNWLQTTNLQFPNGLLIKNNTLYIAAWGTITNGKILEATRGNLLKISLNDKKITKVIKLSET